MNDIVESWILSLGIGLGTGFMVAFIAWAIGFAIYTVIKMFKMA